MSDGYKPPAPQKTLHVDMKDPSRFVLSWRRGDDVLDRFDVPRKGVTLASQDDRVVRYPELAARVGDTWKASGEHRAVDDPARDRAVLHSGDSASYADLVAVMDAIRSVDRPFSEVSSDGRRTSREPAFDLVFSMN